MRCGAIKLLEYLSYRAWNPSENSLGLFQLMQLSDMVELAKGGNGFEAVPGEVDLLPREHSYLTRKKMKTRKNIKLKQQNVYC